MNSEEFAALARVERDHWFYWGKRDLVRHWANALLQLRRNDVLVDVGAGTGQLLSEFADTCVAIGVEPNPSALGIAGGKPLHLVQGSVTELPLASDRADLVTALDVLEHIEDDAAAFAELLRITRPGGFIILHVPAFQLLWSDWDESLGHKRRYTRPGLLRLVNGFDVAVSHCVYINTAAFLPVLCYRLLRRLLPGRHRLEDKVPPAAINRLLYTLFVVPARWGWLSPPLGLSVLCIVQKRPSPQPARLSAPG